MDVDWRFAMMKRPPSFLTSVAYLLLLSLPLIALFASSGCSDIFGCDHELIEPEIVSLRTEATSGFTPWILKVEAKTKDGCTDSCCNTKVPAGNQISWDFDGDFVIDLQTESRRAEWRYESAGNYEVHAFLGAFAPGTSMLPPASDAGATQDAGIDASTSAADASTYTPPYVRPRHASLQVTVSLPLD